MTDLAAFSRKLPEVAEVQTHTLLCSAEGQEFLARQIRESAMDKVVVAGCSPREHENTFRKVLERAGLNPFQLQIANIREQCAWVTPDPAQALEKARLLLQAAVRRVREHESLVRKEIEINPDVLVIGAGVAGLSAALRLAGKDRRVHLVERAPFVGGKVVLYEKIFPGLECGSCLLEPLINRVLHQEQITVHVGSELRELRGFLGHFEAVIAKGAGDVDPGLCLGCGVCAEACPVRVPNEYLLGLGERAAIFLPFPGAQPAVAVLDREHCLRSRGEACRACAEACPLGAVSFDRPQESLEIRAGAVVVATGFEPRIRERAGGGAPGKWGPVVSGLEMEILLNSTGPTGGKVQGPDGRVPERVALLAGLPGPEQGVSWSVMEPVGPFLKYAREIRDQIPASRVTFFHGDLNLGGPEAQQFYRELVREGGVDFIRMEPGASLQWTPEDQGVVLKYSDREGRGRKEFFDLVVAAEELAGSRGSRELAALLRLTPGEDGFLPTLEQRLEPVNTLVEGIYVAGCARGPRDISGSVLDGQAAAGQILSRLVPGERIILEPLAARVDEAGCSGCKICLSVCPFQALEAEVPEGTVRVNEVLCRGCGLCAAACPSGAIEACHFQEGQVAAEVKGLLG